jgi:hypothetical protein
MEDKRTTEKQKRQRNGRKRREIIKDNTRWQIFAIKRTALLEKDSDASEYVSLFPFASYNMTLWHLFLLVVLRRARYHATLGAGGTTSFVMRKCTSIVASVFHFNRNFLSASSFTERIGGPHRHKSCP